MRRKSNGNSILPPSAACRSCQYYRAVKNNLLALRWVTLVPAVTLPFVLVLADVFVSEWHLSAEHITLYVAGILGLVGIAYYGSARVKND